MSIYSSTPSPPSPRCLAADDGPTSGQGNLHLKIVSSREPATDKQKFMTRALRTIAKGARFSLRILIGPQRPGPQALSDRMLRDIGLLRSDAIHADLVKNPRPDYFWPY